MELHQPEDWRIRHEATGSVPPQGIAIRGCLCSSCCEGRPPVPGRGGYPLRDPCPRVGEHLVRTTPSTTETATKDKTMTTTVCDTVQ
jgi:hypothetical protein